MNLYIVMVPTVWTDGWREREREGAGKMPGWLPVARYRHRARAEAFVDTLRAKGTAAILRTANLQSAAAPSEMHALSLTETAVALQISIGRTRSLVRQGKLRAQRIGREYWIDEMAIIRRLDEMIERNRRRMI